MNERTNVYVSNEDMRRVDDVDDGFNETLRQSVGFPCSTEYWKISYWYTQMLSLLMIYVPSRVGSYQSELWLPLRGHCGIFFRYIFAFIAPRNTYVHGREELYKQGYGGKGQSQAYNDPRKFRGHLSVLKKAKRQWLQLRHLTLDLPSHDEHGFRPMGLTDEDGVRLQGELFPRITRLSLTVFTSGQLNAPCWQSFVNLKTLSVKVRHRPFSADTNLLPRLVNLTLHTHQNEIDTSLFSTRLTSLTLLVYYVKAFPVGVCPAPHSGEEAPVQRLGRLKRLHLEGHQNMEYPAELRESSVEKMVVADVNDEVFNMERLRSLVVVGTWKSPCKPTNQNLHNLIVHYVYRGDENSFGLLTSLRSLKVYGPMNTWDLSPNLTNLKQLTSLTATKVSNCDVLQGMTSLRKLTLGGVACVLPDLTSLRALKSMDVSMAGPGWPPPNFPENLTKLGVINIGWVGEITRLSHVDDFTYISYANECLEWDVQLHADLTTIPNVKNLTVVSRIFRTLELPARFLRVLHMRCAKLQVLDWTAAENLEEVILYCPLLDIIPPIHSKKLVKFESHYYIGAWGAFPRGVQQVYVTMDQKSEFREVVPPPGYERPDFEGWCKPVNEVNEVNEVVGK